MSIPQQPRFHAPVLATLVVAVLVGCHTGPDRSTSASTDAVQCGSLAGATRVYVEIEYDAGGMPSAQPETCEIPSGATVTWRGPAGNPAAFEIAFKGASPSATEPRGVFMSRDTGGRQEVQRTLDAAPGRYDYGIRANGRERDPAIIIR